MKYVYSLLVLLLALFLAAFIQQNSVEIQLTYFSWKTPFLPLSLYMILSFAAGYALAVIVGFSSGLKHRFRASGAERELKQLRTELDQLKQEELKAVRSEVDSEKTGTETVDGGADDTPGEEDAVTRYDHDPDDRTAVADEGGEEEKK